MVKAQLGGSNIVTRVLSNQLVEYDGDTTIYIPRSTISGEIVKLQRSGQQTDRNNQKLKTLINSLCTEVKKRRYIRMSAKDVIECFEGDVISVYIDN